MSLDRKRHAVQCVQLCVTSVFLRVETSVPQNQQCQPQAPSMQKPRSARGVRLGAITGWWALSGSCGHGTQRGGHGDHPVPGTGLSRGSRGVVPGAGLLVSWGSGRPLFSPLPPHQPTGRLWSLGGSVCRWRWAQLVTGLDLGAGRHPQRHMLNLYPSLTVFGHTGRVRVN